MRQFLLGNYDFRAGFSFLPQPGVSIVNRQSYSYPYQTDEKGPWAVREHDDDQNTLGKNPHHRKQGEERGFVPR